MTEREFTILSLLDRWGPMTPGELAASWPGPYITTHQNMTANLTRLAKRKFVYREPDGIWQLEHQARWLLEV